MALIDDGDHGFQNEDRGFSLTVTDFGVLNESSPLAGEDRPRSGQMRGTTRETTVGFRASPSEKPGTSRAFWLAPPHPALRATFPREGGRPLCPPPPKSVTVRFFFQARPSFRDFRVLRGSWLSDRDQALDGARGRRQRSRAGRRDGALESLPGVGGWREGSAGAHRGQPPPSRSTGVRKSRGRGSRRLARLTNQIHRRFPRRRSGEAGGRRRPRGSRCRRAGRRGWSGGGCRPATRRRRRSARGSRPANA